MVTATAATAQKTQGVVKVIRKLADTTVKQHIFSSAKIDWITIHNASDVDIKYNFDDQDSSLSTHYRTLKPGVESRKIGITKNTTMEFTAISGSAKRIEITAWG